MCEEKKEIETKMKRVNKVSKILECLVIDLVFCTREGRSSGIIFNKWCTNPLECLRLSHAF